MFTATIASQVGATLRDLVYDFVTGTDEIDVSQIDANTALAGNQAFTFNGTVAKANSIWLVDTGTDFVVRGDVNGTTVADFEIQIVNLASITAGDFVL